MQVLITLNNARLALGRFVRGIGMFIFGIVGLTVFAFVAAIFIDTGSAIYFGIGKSFGLTSLFFSPTYGRNDTGLEGFAAAILLGIVTGFSFWGIGWVIGIGDDNEW